MSSASYLSKVQSFFKARGQGRSPDPATDLLATGMLDSLELAVFLSYLEREFEVDITVAEVTPEHFGTIAATLRFLESKLNER